MVQSDVIRYALIAMKAGRNDGVFSQDYQIGITALGLSELAGAGVFTVDGDDKIRCQEGKHEIPEYLLPLEKTAMKENGKSFGSFLLSIFTGSIGEYERQIENFMEKEKLIKILTEKNKLGIENRIIQVSPQYADECTSYIRDICLTNEIHTDKAPLIRILIKTDMMTGILDKNEIKGVKQKLKNIFDTEADDAACATLDMADKTCVAAVSIIATMMLV